MNLWQILVPAGVAVALFYAGTQFRAKEQRDDEISERIDEIIEEINNVEEKALKFWMDIAVDLDAKKDNCSIESILSSRRSLTFALGELEARVHRISSLADLACRQLRHVNYFEYEDLVTKLRQAVTLYGLEQDFAELPTRSGSIVTLSSRLIVCFRAIRRSNLPRSAYSKLRQYLLERALPNRARYWEI